VIARLFVAYLTANPSSYRPYREELLKVQPGSVSEVLEQTVFSEPASKVRKNKFFKHIAKQLGLVNDLSWVKNCRNVILVRDPALVLNSYHSALGEVILWFQFYFR
jgi:hypothetical protein